VNVIQELPPTLIDNELADVPFVRILIVGTDTEPDGAPAPDCMRDDKSCKDVIIAATSAS
jgi:hypothetical protein